MLCRIQALLFLDPSCWVLPAGSSQLYAPLIKIKEGHLHLVSHVMPPCHWVATLSLSPPHPPSGEAAMTPGSQRARAHTWSVHRSRRLLEIAQPHTVRVVFTRCFTQITANLAAYNDTSLLLHFL